MTSPDKLDYTLLVNLKLSSKCWFILSMIGLTDLSESIVVCESVINDNLIGLAEKCLYNSLK